MSPPHLPPHKASRHMTRARTLLSHLLQQSKFSEHHVTRQHVVAAVRSEWKAAVEASAAAATKQLEELKRQMAAEAAAAPGRDKALLQQARDAAATLVHAQVDAAKAELLKQLEGWGEKVKAAAGAEAAERVKAGSEVRVGWTECM